jgi:uncharacterized OB-fold protein
VKLEPQTSTPLPRPTPLSRPHWDGCREGRLRVQRCRACGNHVFIPLPLCNACGARELEWVDTSGRGTVYSYTTVWRPQRPEFQVPYTVAIVEMEEGWHLLTNLIGCEPAQVRVGMPVQVDFRRRSDEITLPYFRPAQA